MKQKTKKRTSRLAEKLRKAAQNLNVDVFGYESKVTRNIIKCFSELSKETGLEENRLIIRIFRDRGAINVAVYNQGIPIKKISVKELITLFTNSEPSGIFNLETSVVKGIESFMVDISKRNNITVSQLQICITTIQDIVIVKAYKGIEFVEDIPLGVLIKHFTR